jgi:hypothetical protein
MLNVKLRETLTWGNDAAQQAQQLTAELLSVKVALEKSERRALQHEQTIQDNAAARKRLLKRLHTSDGEISQLQSLRDVATAEHNAIQKDMDNMVASLREENMALNVSLKQESQNLQSALQQVCDRATSEEIRSCSQHDLRRLELQLSGVLRDVSSALLQSELVQAPHDYMCPITQEIMECPVMCTDGHTYERAAIAEWLSAHSTSPKTNIELSSKSLMPNHTLKAAIDTFLTSKRGLTAEWVNM